MLLKEADHAFVNLFGSIDARYIVLYSANGIMEIERLYELLEPRHARLVSFRLLNETKGAKARNKMLVYLRTGEMANFNLTMGT